MTSYAGPRRFFVEFETDERCPFDFTEDPTIVLFFASWAYAVEFGANHELAAAARHLKQTLRVDLRPLLRYADRNVESEADRQELERSWQPAAELAACARAVAEHWEQPDERLAALAAGYEHLGPRLRELATMCDWGAARGARVRLSFDLEHSEQRTARPR